MRGLWAIWTVRRPPTAVCVMVEEGGSGGSVAAPIAGQIFAYLGRMGQ